MVLGAVGVVPTAAAHAMWSVVRQAWDITDGHISLLIMLFKAMVLPMVRYCHPCYMDVYMTVQHSMHCILLMLGIAT